MIDGFAEPSATAAHAERLSPLSHHDLGRTRLSVTAAGFGTYRVALADPVHREALASALTGGINLVDTASSYGGGEAEALIGDVLARLVPEGRIRRDELVLVSKAG